MKGQQSHNLPVTSSSYIVDDKGTESYFLFIVLILGVLINILLQLVPVSAISANSFPIAVVIDIFVFFGFKRYLNGKPRKFLLHLMMYPAIPKKYTHQFTEKVSGLADE